MKKVVLVHPLFISDTWDSRHCNDSFFGGIKVEKVPSFNSGFPVSCFSALGSNLDFEATGKVTFFYLENDL